MRTIPQVCEALTNTLTETADEMASETGFVQRRSKLSGANFVTSLVFGWLKHPDATLEQLVQTTAGLGVRISPQGLSKRFSPQAAQCLKGVLEAAVGKVIATESVALEILRRFNGVYVQDSTVVVLPDELAEVWSWLWREHIEGNECFNKAPGTFRPEYWGYWGSVVGIR